MAAHTGAAFVPFMAEVTTVLLNAAVNNWHPLVKAEVANAMSSMIVPFVAQDHNGEISWNKGDISAQANTTSSQRRGGTRGDGVQGGGTRIRILLRLRRTGRSYSSSSRLLQETGIPRHENWHFHCWVK